MRGRKENNKRWLWITAVLFLTLLLWIPEQAGAQESGRKIYVSQERGSNGGNGTKESPYLTINKAAQAAEPGDTVVVQKGVYRECVKPVRGGTSEKKRITYLTEEPGEAVIKGSEQITDWEQVKGNVWRTVLVNEQMFPDYNPYIQGHGKDTFDYFPVYNCGDVYLNEEAYYQKASAAELEGNTRTWYSEVDEKAGTTSIYANFGSADPNKELAEINVRQQCFAPDAWGLAYITVNGFKVQHAANMYSDFPGYPEHCQSGAISTNGGLKWIIENNTVINARSIAIDIGLRCDLWAGNRDPRDAAQHPEDRRYFTSYKDTEKYGQHIVRNNLIQKSGQCAVAGVFSWKSQVINNVIEDTNYRNEFIAAETGGIKLHYCNDGLIKGNYVRNTVGGGSAGIWTDWGNQGIRITQNVLVNNNWGYYAEAVVGPILVDNNIFIDNNQFRSLDGAGIVFANNLFFNENMAYDGEGRNCMVFDPHTMNDREVYSSPQHFKWYNNLSINKPIKTPKGPFSVMKGNSSNAGSDFKYQASTDSVTLSFQMKEDPAEDQAVVNPALIGIIMPAGEGIRSIVNTDYFGNKFDEASVTAGPFADLKKGENTYTVWPPKGITAPPSTTKEEENLALGKKTEASSHTGENTPDKAVDGSTGSRYESAQTDKEWFLVDLGEAVQIEKIKIIWESAYAKAYVIQVSEDKENWKDVYSTDRGDGGTDLLEFREKARYVRLNCSERGSKFGYSFWEFQIFGGTETEQVKPPVFQDFVDQAGKEGEDVSFRVQAADPAGKTVRYRVLGSLPKGARLNEETGQFSWTPDSSQSGCYAVTFLADNKEASSARTILIQVEEALQEDEKAPEWKDGSCIASEVKDTSLQLSWTAAEDESGVDCYRIYENGLMKKEVDGDITETYVGGLEPGKAYTFTIEAEDLSGNVTRLEDGPSAKAATMSSDYGAALGISRTYPAEYSDWANAFVAGDGKIGIMVFGNPLEETVIYNDRKFFMAATADKPKREINTVSQEDLDQIKTYLANEEWRPANELANQVHGWKDGGEGNKHPGYKMMINILGEAGTVEDYSRVCDYATGEIAVNWRDDRGTWKRTAFVSRKDSTAVEYLTSPSGADTFDCSLRLATDPGMHFPAGMKFEDASTEEYLNIRAAYANAEGAGYEGVTKVLTDGTKSLNQDGEMQVQGASYVLLLTKNEKYYTDCEEGWKEKKLQKKLDQLPKSYESLMEGQIQTHKEIYDRVSMSLNAPKEDRLLPNEELLELQKKSQEPVLALYEKIFAAGRYHYLSSSSEVAPPDLLGLWTGDTEVGWSGYYHLDANLNLQISSGNIGNMPEAMEGYFHLMDKWKDDFRTNASKLLGCRGFLSGGNSPGETSGIISSLNFAYPYQYVTGGEAWLLYPFWEYYQITRDETFLREELYPYLKEMGYFYEDFLTEKDENGKYIFAGSISPESQPKGLGLSLVNNSTFDITGAQFVLTTLLDTCEILGIQESEAAPVSRWKQILEDLPPYMMNKDNALSEWAWPSLKDSDNYAHRHSSHLIGVWPYRTITAEKTPELYAAARTALQKKDGNAYENAGHGILHSALIATNLNDGESVGAKIIRLLRDGFYFDSLTTAHYNNRNTFCTDVANTMPGIMMEMCMSSTEDTLELLPALPAALGKGSISGLKAKCQITLDQLDWDMDSRKIACRITSDVDQTITLIERAVIGSMESSAPAEASELGDIARRISLKAGETAEIEIRLAEDDERNLAHKKPAVASSESNAEQGASKAVDGNMGTRWGAGEADENWIYVDLEDTYDISKVKIYWEDSYAKRYKIQVSNNKEDWKDVYSNEANEGGLNEIPLKASGRYVRVQGLEKSGQWGYSIYELEVYGTLPPPPVNLALNKPAKALNSSNEQQTPDKAFDGSTATRWGGHQDDENWIYVDLEEMYIVESVVLNWEDSYAKEYKIQVSEDEENWTDVYETHDSPGGVETISLKEPAETRFVRMQGIKRSGEWGFSLYEFEVYGRELPPPENVAAHKTASASSASNPEQTPDKAFDQNQDTRWGADEVADSWIMVDLEAYYDLSDVKIYWEDSFAKGYRLQASMDGVHWEDLYVEENNQGGLSEIPVEAAARYVKMQGVEKSGQWGYSIWEFEVYGRLSKNQNPVLNHPPVFKTVPEQHVTLGDTIEFILEAEDEDGDVLAYEMTGETPEGAQLNRDTGAFSWTPQNTGDYKLSFQVSDGTESSEMIVPVTVEAPAADVTAPEWPQGSTLAFSEIGTVTMTLAWPEALDETGVIQYELFMGDTLLSVQQPDARSYPVTGLEAGKEYSFSVIAVDAAGNRSEALEGKAVTNQGTAEVDKTALLALIHKAEEIKPGLYTTESYQNFEKKLMEASRVAGNGEASQAEADQAVQKLQAAMDGLEKKAADKEALKSLAAQAESLNQDLYTAETVGELQKALEEAKKVLSKENMTIEHQAEVDQAVWKLQAAIAGLKKKPEIPQQDPEKETAEKLQKTLVKAAASNVGTRYIKISWKKTEHADGYVVLLKKGKKWETLREVRNAKAGSFTYKKTALKKSYTFAVKAYKIVKGQKVYSRYQTVSKRAVPQAPVLKKKAGKGKITVSWKKISKADGYVVLRREGKGKWKTAGTCGAGKTRFMDRKVKKSRSYTYKVKAYKKDGKKKKVYGAYSGAIQVKAK